MTSRITGLALAVGLGACLGVAFVPLGCGGSEEVFYPVPRPREEPKLPEEVARQLETCVKRASAPFPPAEGSTYVIDFDVKVHKDGSVHAVETRDSMLGGHEVEACFGRVLAGMTLPKRTIAMGLARPRPRGAAAPPSRALLGQAVAIPNPFSLLPVIITVAAVCVAVWVTVQVVSTATADAPPLVTALPVASAVPTTTAIPVPTVAPGPLEIEAQCMPLLIECLENPTHPKPKTWGPRKDCNACFQECKHQKGVWPDYKCPRN